MIFNNDFGGMNGLGGMGGGYGGNGGGYGNGYRRGNYINSDYCGLGSFSSPNPLGVPMRVGGYFDSGSLYGGYGSMNMQNVGTYLMLEQLMEHSNHNNNNNYNNNNNGYNNQNNGYNNNNGFNNQQNNGYNNNNNGFNNQQNNGYNNNNGFNNQQNNGYNNNNGFNNQQNNGYNNNNNGFNNQQNNGYNNNNNGFNNQQNNGYNNNNNGFNNQQNNGYNNNNNGFNNQQNNGYNNNNGFNNNGMPNRGMPNNGMNQPSLGPVNGGSNIQGGFNSSQSANHSSSAPVTAPSNLPKPKRRRPGVANPGTPLMKGQKIPITGSGRIKIGLGWDVNDSRCDLDASAFMLDKNNRIVGDEWFIFYGQDTSPDNSVKYKTFDIGVACEDDAELTVDLNSVSPNVEKILIAITIYEASANRLNFGMVSNVYARIIDGDSNKETSRFVQDECYSNVTALVLGELYRYKGAWKFNAVGSGVARDLAEFCGMYGVVLA